MDAETKPKKPWWRKTPWWRKKRWRAVAAVWLALPPLYVLSLGPADYGVQRGWLAVETYAAAYSPVVRLIESGRPVGRVLGRYARWWEVLGETHEGHEYVFDPRTGGYRPVIRGGGFSP